jgi:hypothetical protein
VSPVKYEQGFYIPEDGILHSHRRENLESYMIRHRSFRQTYVHLPLSFFCSFKSDKAMSGEWVEAVHSAARSLAYWS